MSFVKIPHCSHSFEPQRPTFNHQNTQDRLREADLRKSSMTSKIKKERKSVFREVGLAGEEDGATTVQTKSIDEPTALDEKGDPGQLTGPAPLNTRSAEHRSTADGRACGPEKAGTQETGDDSGNESPRQTPSGAGSHSDASSPPQSPTSKTPWYAKLATGRRPRVRQGSSAPPSPVQGFSAMMTLVLAVAVMAPLLGRSTQDPASIVDAGPVMMRANSPTNVCARWAQQTALLNGTLYIYGGEAKTTVDQQNDTWNNDFLTLDLTSTWDTSSPALTGLPQPNGPPAVALGNLWYDYNNLYLYGGEFADNPYVEPAAVATWKYAISSGTWTSYTDLTTSAGNASDAGGVAVQRAAEGAGVSVPELGLSWYFGGHLDWSTTPGWSNQISRVYLKSLLEFTHPGYTNDAVTSLLGSGAPAAGAYRNITQGGLQDSDAFTERADGVLIFVPGWGTSGVLIGLGGGTASEFTNDMSTLDVYDIASSQWYHQQTTGTAPGVRVNPCGVVASAPDASSFQVYLFGGQNLQPAGNQIQYDDMYILTIPSFTWIGPISHSGSGSSIPYARAGHTCNLRDGQMVVVGGFNTTVTSCDSQGGVYVFNASSLEWLSSFTALSTSDDHDAGNTVRANSYGYTVPDQVVSVIGGNPSGSATVTTPAASATGGPFATGQPPVYTVTASGSTATITSGSGSGGGGATGLSTSSSSGRNNGGLIAAIVVACLAGVSAGYLGYCAWLYRRQVRAYKTHLAVTNRFPARSASHGSFGRMLAFGRKGSGHRRARLGAGAGADTDADADADADADTAPMAAGGKRPSWWGGGRRHRRDERGADSAGGESFAWVGREKLLNPNSAGANNSATSNHYNNNNHNKATPSSSGSRPSPWSAYGDDKSGGSGSASRGSGEASGTSGENQRRRAGSTSGGSTSSTEGLLDGQEPSFFSVVLGPRRALRVVNGLEETEGH